MKASPEAPLTSPPEALSQRRRPEAGRYRLEVDRQMKKSFSSLEDAQVAGLAIKTAHPIVRVSIYDVVDRENIIVELPTA